MRVNVITFVSIVLMTFSLCESSETGFDSTGLAYTRVLDFELEISSINQVFRELGESEIYESGDGSEYSKRISYFLSENKFFITFDVTEVGGGSIIHQFILSRTISDKNYKSLANIKIDSSGVGGLTIGMQRSKFIELFGSKCTITPERVYVNFNQKIPISLTKVQKQIPDDITHCDQSISLSAKFENNEMIELSVFKFTTY